MTEFTESVRRQNFVSRIRVDTEKLDPCASRSRRREIQTARQLAERIAHNPLREVPGISPGRAVCFYHHRSLISSSKCRHVRAGCQKRRSRRYVSPVAAVIVGGLYDKRGARGVNGSRDFRFRSSPPASRVVSPHGPGGYLCSEIP